MGQPASLCGVTTISGRTSSKGVPVGSVSYGRPAQHNQGGTAAWLSCCWPWVLVVQSLECREGTGPGHWLSTSMGMLCLSPGSDAWVSQVLFLLHLARCSSSEHLLCCRRTKLGDLPGEQGTSSAGFVVRAGSFKSSCVHISGRCRSYFFNLRCPHGFACLVRS